MPTLNSVNRTVSSASEIVFVAGGSIGSTSVAPSERHDRKGALGDDIELGIGRGVAREETPIDPDPGTAQCAGSKSGAEVARHPPTGDRAERRAQGIEHDRDVGDGPAHGARRVLAVRDRDHAVLRDEPDRRLEPDDRVARRRADDRAIGLRADRHGTQVGGRRDRRARAGAARIRAEVVGIAGEPAARAPAVEIEAGLLDRRRDDAAEVGPFGQVGLAQDDRTRRPQPGDDRRVAADPAAEQGQRPRRRLHLVVGRDVVLEQDRDPVQRTAGSAGTSFRVPTVGDRQRLGVRLDDGVEEGIESFDPPQVGLGQLGRGERARRHRTPRARGSRPRTTGRSHRHLASSGRRWRHGSDAPTARTPHRDPGRREASVAVAQDDERVLERVSAGAADPDPADRQLGCQPSIRRTRGAWRTPCGSRARRCGRSCAMR